MTAQFLRNNRRFYLSVVLPSALAIILFIVTIHAFFIPFFEREIMENKKEMISELTNTAWSLLNKIEKQNADSLLSLEEAQEIAKQQVSQIRYGIDQKDYFWIIDKTPVMIMHPYNSELVGKELNNYMDPNGIKLFVEAANVVEENQEGFINYMWQWMDDSTHVVPKLSYVKSFEPWGWIVGTGIYLEDVEEELSELRKSLLVISLGIASIITFILFYVVRKSLIIEIKRQNLTTELHESKQKYKTLVEASNEGTLMFLNGSVIFANAKFRSICGLEQTEIYEKNIEQLFTASWDEIYPKFTDTLKSVSIESSIICANNILKEVVLLVSKVEYNQSFGFIFSIKEVSGKEIAERGLDKISGEIKTSLLLMNQPIKHLIQPIITCSSISTIQSAANQMEKAKKDFIFVKHDKAILGVVTSADISKRAVAKNSDLSTPVSSIMSAPLCTIKESAGLHEALLQFSNDKVSHLATTDSNNAISGVIAHKSIISLQHNTFSLLLHEIESARTVEELAQIHDRVPGLMYALANSNEDINSILSLASSISDKITQRIIAFATEIYGDAPCEFVFIAVGSEGRREQTLQTDQDNAIIFEDGHPQEKVKEYFLEIANYISDSLNEIGYNYCKGGVMACNPKWCQPLSKWKEYFSVWVESTEIDSLIEVSTFLDLRVIHGDADLSKELKQHVFSITGSNTEFLLRLAEMTANFKSPINAFGNLVGNDLPSKEKTIDLKTILTPMVKYCRVKALKCSIEDTNTIQRISAIYQAGKVSEEFKKNFHLAYNYLLKLRLKNQSSLIQAGEKPSNIINISELSSIEKSFLKSIFSLINSISNKVTSEIRK